MEYFTMWLTGASIMIALSCYVLLFNWGIYKLGGGRMWEDSYNNSFPLEWLFMPFFVPFIILFFIAMILAMIFGIPLLIGHMIL